MKTAGIVLRNFKNGLSELDFSSSDAFLKAGYPFEEVRLLSRKDREAFLKAAEELAAESENLVVIAEKSLLPSAREWLSEKFNTNFLQGTLSGAGLFEKEDCSLFLVSPDDGESGAEYVRNVCVPFWKKVFHPLRSYRSPRRRCGKRTYQRAFARSAPYERGQVDV